MDGAGDYAMLTLPEDLKALSAADLEALLDQARENAAQVLADSPNDVDALRAAKAGYDAVLAEKNARGEADAARAELAAAIEEPPAPVEDEAPAEPEVPAAPAVTEPAAVTATAAPVVPAPRPAPRSTIDPPAPDSGPEYAVMLVAPDVPGMAGGQKLTSFATAAEALTNRLKAYPKPSQASRKAAGPAPTRRVGKNAFALDLTGRSYVRHGGVVLQRQFPEELQIDSSNAGAALKFASKESRLPGGSLLSSAKQAMANGKALTAAVGWCAPSEVIYNLCDLSSLDGILDLPELQASRGGFQVPADGGPDFSVIWGGIGDEGDVVLTEYDIENGATKSCFEIPCPEFEDVRLDAAYVCLTGSLLQRRTYPEVVELFSQQSMKALAHKINQSVISKIVTASGSATTIPADASGDDAASGILSAVDLAVQDIKYRERMSREATLEVVLPYWALVQIRAAMARRYGIGRLDVTDRMIFDWFEIRSAMPRFVYDWQDAFTGLVTGPGGATPLTALPTTVQFLIYPAGTWTKIVQDVVHLDTIYDNAMLTTNEYTAIFAEDGFNVIQTCPISRLYTAQADPSGVVGCCA